MKSSKMENVFNLNPSLEASKSLSPLTYYQPFGSSFDPEFGAQSGRGGHPERSPRRRADNRQESLQASRRAVGLWGEQGNPTHSSHPACSPSVWRQEGDWTTVPSSSRASLLPAPPPAPPFSLENHSPGYFGEGTRTHPNYPPGFGCSTAESPPSFDNAGVRLQGTPQASALQHPVYYPLVASRFATAKNSSQNVYKTGHHRPRMCNFCKNNKEVPDIYLNHYLYDPETKVLTCPVLRKHVCEICGGTGDRAHTLQYCPVNRERGLQAKVPVLLKTRTITNSTGKIRRN